MLQKGTTTAERSDVNLATDEKPFKEDKYFGRAECSTFRAEAPGKRKWKIKRKRR